MRRLAVIVALMLLAPATARAGFIPAVAVDGPSADVLSAGDVELARDGAGAVTYLRLEGGAAHVFASTLVLGAPGPPQRLDVGQVNASAQPRVAASNGGRVLVTWVNDGQLFASLRPSSAEAFSPPVTVSSPSQAGVRDPSLSMTINGKAYAGFTTASGDVWAAYMAVDGSWTLPDAPLDVDPARTAAGSAVAASGDGTALFAWTETGADGVSHVLARRVIRQRLGTVPREVSVGSLDGRPGGSADSPGVGIEYDPSYAWVVFRQDFDDGGVVTSRALVRRLKASDFDPPAPIDGLTFPAGNGADQPRIAFTGRGRGTFSAGLRGPFGVMGTLLKNDVFQPTKRLDAGSVGAPPFAVPTAADDSTGTVSWQRGVGIVGSHFDAKLVAPEVELSVPDFGPVDASAGLEASADRPGNAAITFAQGDPAVRRVVVALYDLPPRAPAAHNDERWRADARPTLHWAAVVDAWSSTPVTYRLEIDHVAVRTLTTTTYRPRTPIPDGDHRWRIVTTDGRGQETVGIDRFLRIDTRRPAVAVRLSGRARRGAASTFTASVGDGTGGSGVTSVEFDFGDG
ncbi:MAG: hypothetical protein QOJ57_1052, partial [Thermoleophilaceae bacterium]|nr:hypothetical protein [Thermoleophilaceae bacterium]